MPAPADLSKLSDIVKMILLKKMCIMLWSKILCIKLILILNTNTNLNAKINEVKNGIPSITKLARTPAFTAKINEVKNKNPNITNLAITTAFTPVENKINDHNEYITTPEFNKLTTENFATKLAQTNSANKIDIIYKKDWFWW